MVIDEDVLLKAVVRDIKAEKPAHARNVRVELGEIADDGCHFDVMVVADDLAELESLGKLKLAPTFEPTPKTRIPYVLPSEQ